MHLILVVDDQAVVRDPVAAALRNEGYETETACNGAEAMAKIRLEMPSLILLDVTMPGMDGLQVLEVLRDDPALATIPVILLTASGDKKKVMTAAKLGVRDYLLKSSFIIGDLIARVRRYLPTAA